MSQNGGSPVSRREVMQAGLLAGLGITLFGCATSSSPLLNSAGQRIITKAIPSTGERIPVIGIGTTQFGRTEPNVVRDVLKRMHEMGGTVIDTAGLYPGSEAAIGPALSDLKLRSKMFLATKFNAAGVVDQGVPPPPGVVLFKDETNGLATFERSLQRLQTDKVDLLMAHWLDSVDPLMPVMLDLKKAGRVRYIGITNNLPELQPRLAAFMRKYPLDFVQVQYRLNDRSAEQEILPIALERGIAIMAAVPFGGARDLLFSQIRNRQLPEWAAEFDAKTWGQFFLKYVVSHPAVTCAIPGSNDVAHIEDNQAAGLGRLPDAAMRKKIEDFWAGRA